MVLGSSSVSVMRSSLGLEVAGPGYSCSASSPNRDSGVRRNVAASGEGVAGEEAGGWPRRRLATSSDMS